VSFALRFGFAAIFAAIGFNDVAVDRDTAVVDLDPACLEVDEELEPIVMGLPVLRVVVATGLPRVVGLPVLRVVVATGLPRVVGVPVLRVVVIVATGLPLVVGLTDAGGLADLAPCPWANAGESVIDVAARKPRIVAETRIRVPP